MKIDFLSSGIQKWLLGLEGTTFIHISKELQERIEPKYVGWLSVKNPWNILDYNLELAETAQRFENGTINFAGIYSLNSNLKFFSSLGINEIEKSVIENSRLLIQLLEREQFQFLFKPDMDNEVAGIVTIKTKNPEEVYKELKRRKIHISIREGYLRFSPHFYNTDEEIYKVVNNLKEICSGL